MYNRLVSQKTSNNVSKNCAQEKFLLPSYKALLVVYQIFCIKMLRKVILHATVQMLERFGLFRRFLAILLS
jgi:hypothetical protein